MSRRMIVLLVAVGVVVVATTLVIASIAGVDVQLIDVSNSE